MTVNKTRPKIPATEFENRPNFNEISFSKNLPVGMILEVGQKRGPISRCFYYVGIRSRWFSTYWAQWTDKFISTHENVKPVNIV